MVEAATMPKLDVPYISQKDPETSDRYGRRGCGLTAIRMALAYNGANLPLDQLDELIEKTGAYTEEKGWIHAGLVDIARGVGLQGYRINYEMLRDEDLEKAKEVFKNEGASDGELQMFEDSFKEAKSEGSMADLKRLIDLSIPPVTSMQKSYASTLASHMIVIKGYKDGNLLVNDPWDFGPDYIISEEEFLKHWTKKAIIITK